MKRRKFKRLVQLVLAERERIGDEPVTFDTLEVDFIRKRVRFRGQTMDVTADRIVIPLLSTDRVVLSQSGDVW